LCESEYIEKSHILVDCDFFFLNLKKNQIKN